MNNSVKAMIDGNRMVFPDQVITWAGKSFRENEFALGMDNGFLRFTGVDVFLGDDRARKVVQSAESINGAAFVERESDRLVAVSTRAELFVHFLTKENVCLRSFAYDGGAHGVSRTAWGGFLAPLGPQGLLLIEPELDRNFTRSLVFDKLAARYFYEIASLGLRNNKELWVGAGRTDGLYAILLSQDGKLEMRRAFQLRSHPLDVISVCSIGNAEYPRAVAGLGRDRSILLSFDLDGDRRPVLLNLPEMRGTAYKILSFGGHIFIHTKKAIYICRDIANRFLHGDTLDGSNPVKHSPVDCFDFEIVFDKMLLLKHCGMDILPLSKLLEFSSESMQTNASKEIDDFDPVSDDSMTSGHSKTEPLRETVLHMV